MYRATTGKSAYHVPKKKKKKSGYPSSTEIELEENEIRKISSTKYNDILLVVMVIRRTYILQNTTKRIIVVSEILTFRDS